MAALARWCFQRRVLVLVAWLGLLVILGVTGRAAGSAYSNTLTVPGTGSTAALTLLHNAFPGHAGDQDSIVWRVSSGTVEAPATRARITAMLAKVAAAPSVASVVSPYSAAGAGQVSRSGQIAYATVVFDAQAANLAKADVNHVISLTEAARSPGLQVELGGQAIENSELPSSATSIGVAPAAAAVVLFVAFGSLLAMLVPLIIAIVALVSGLMMVELVSHAVSIASIAPTMAVLIGLGVGVDYALFVVTRHRNNPRSGSSVGPSLAASSANMSEPPKIPVQSWWPSSGTPHAAGPEARQHQDPRRSDRVLCGGNARGGYRVGSSLSGWLVATGRRMQVGLRGHAPPGGRGWPTEPHRSQHDHPGVSLALGGRA